MGECEDEIRTEEEKLADEIENAKKGIKRGLATTLIDTESRIKEELEQRINELRDEFDAKLKEEKLRAQEDSERMQSDEVNDIKERHEKKMRSLRQNDDELQKERRRMEEATDRVRDL